jgi:hypothetical protein
MVGIEGMKVWAFCLIEFDKAGRGKIIKSFMKPAKDSTVKQKEKTKQTKKKKSIQSKQDKEIDLF